MGRKVHKLGRHCLVQEMVGSGLVGRRRNYPPLSLSDVISHRDNVPIEIYDLGMRRPDLQKLIDATEQVGTGKFSKRIKSAGKSFGKFLLGRSKIKPSDLLKTASTVLTAAGAVTGQPELVLAGQAANVGAKAAGVVSGIDRSYRGRGLRLAGMGKDYCDVCPSDEVCECEYETQGQGVVLAGSGPGKKSRRRRGLPATEHTLKSKPKRKRRPKAPAKPLPQIVRIANEPLSKAPLLTNLALAAPPRKPIRRRRRASSAVKAPAKRKTSSASSGVKPAKRKTSSASSGVKRKLYIRKPKRVSSSRVPKRPRRKLGPRVGTIQEVWDGVAFRTRKGETKKDLVLSRRGKPTTKARVASGKALYKTYCIKG